MAPLKLYSSTQRWDAEGTEGSGPVGDGEAGVVAGDERPGNDKDKGRAGYEDGEAMVRAIVWCGDGLQALTPLAGGKRRAGRVRDPSLQTVRARTGETPVLLVFATAP
jgi:hypothetical protein